MLKKHPISLLAPTRNLNVTVFLPISRSYFKITGWCGLADYCFLPSGIAKARKFYHGWFLPTTLNPRAMRENHLGSDPGHLRRFLHKWWSMASRAIKCVYNYNNRKNLANSRIFSLQPYFAAHPVLLLVLFPAHPWLVWPYPRASLPFLLTLRPFPGQPCHSAV